MTSVNQIIRQAQRGLLYKDGQLVRWLGPGRHVYRGWFAEYEVTVVDLERGWVAATPELRAIVPESEADDLHVKANQLAIVTVDGELLSPKSASRSSPSLPPPRHCRKLANDLPVDPTSTSQFLKDYAGVTMGVCVIGG